MKLRKLIGIVVEYIHLASDKEQWRSFTRYEAWNDGKTITFQITTNPQANRFLWSCWCWAFNSDGHDPPAPPLPGIQAVADPGPDPSTNEQ